MKIDSDIHICIRNGISIYPLYQRRFQVIGKHNFHQGNWYIEVDNNGRKTRYPKPVGTGLRLNSKDYENEIAATFKFWADKISNI